MANQPDTGINRSISFVALKGENLSTYRVFYGDFEIGAVYKERGKWYWIGAPTEDPNRYLRRMSIPREKTPRGRVGFTTRRDAAEALIEFKVSQEKAS